MLPLADPELLSQAIEYLPDALVIVDKTGTIVLANRQTEVIFGYPRAILAGKPVEWLMPERFRSRHHGHFSKFMADPHVRPMGANLPFVAIDQDGNEFPVAINLSPLVTTEGKFAAAVIRHKDVEYKNPVSVIIDTLNTQISALSVSPPSSSAVDDRSDRDNRDSVNVRKNEDKINGN